MHGYEIHTILIGTSSYFFLALPTFIGIIMAMKYITE